MRARIILVLSIITIIISLQLFADTEPMGAAMRYRAGKNDLELYIGGLTAIDEKTSYNPVQDNILPYFPEFKTAPPGLKRMSSAVIKDRSKPAVISQSCYYQNLHIESTLEIDTGHGDIVISVNNLTFGSNGHIVIRGSGKATIFVRGDIDLHSGSSINSSGRYEILEIYHDGSQARFQGGAGGEGRYKFSGILYTKSKNVIIENGARINGSIYAERADITIRGVELDTRVIYTKRGNISINNGAKLAGVLAAGGNNLSISGGSRFDGFSGGIYAPEARVTIDQGAVIIGKIVAHSNKVSIKNINQGESNYWLVAPGRGYNHQWVKKPVYIKEVIISSTVKTPSFELYYWDDYGWQRIYPDTTTNGVMSFYENISSNRLLIKNPYNIPIREIIIK